MSEKKLQTLFTMQLDNKSGTYVMCPVQCYPYTPEEHKAVQEALLEEWAKGVKEGLASPNAASVLFKNQKRCFSPCSDWAIQAGHCICHNERPFEKLTINPESVSTKEAVAKLCKELKEDEGYYIGWKANIAMAFIDEFYRIYPENELLEVKSIANTAADNFLKLLMSQP